MTAGTFRFRVRSRRMFAAALLSGSMLWPTGVALAQDAEANAFQDSAATEIIVTARRRSETLQEVPIAGSVVSGDTLKTQNLVLRLYRA